VNLDQARANLSAAQANVRRLEELESFKRISAPYDGVIIRRNVDIGDLIDAGAASNAQPMFTIARTDPLRVYIYVPQTYANRVRGGMAVDVRQLELADQVFKGTVARTAGAIDPATRTMQVEVDLPNADGRLLPGAYVQVGIPGLMPSAVLVPASALLFRSKGLRLAALDDAARVSLRPVRIGRDPGDAVEILEGVSERDTLVLNPPDSLADGDVVTVVGKPGP
jgi:RND family efflux transporter MFP subunit